MKQLKTAIIVPGVIVLAGLLIGANPANAAPISAELSASPKTATGKCPVKISFKGFIKSGKRGEVKYRFIRSDGAKGPIKTLVFSKPGAMPVGTTWTLGGPGLRSYSGWEQIVVLAPHRARSNRARFKMRCDAGKGEVGALPDLKIVRVVPRINSRVAGICRTGRKDRPGRSIPVLNFDLVVKNVGRGTAYMDRYGVVLSAQTTDFRERVFDTNKRYLGGTGGPGRSRWGPWAHIRMTPIAPGATFVAHTALGIGYNNTTFTVSRMHELAGQTHRFLIKMTSYGSPGLRESNTRNNKTMVRYRFPRNFCRQNVIRGGGIKPVVTGYDYASGKSCASPGGLVTIVGTGFGNTANGRYVELGGHGVGIQPLAIQSWNNTRIRVRVPRRGIRNNQTYWLAINKGQRHLSNLKYALHICQQNVIRGGLVQSGASWPYRLEIQSFRVQLKRPYECRTDGPKFATVDIVLKNIGGDFVPSSSTRPRYGLLVLGVDDAYPHVRVGRNNALQLRGLTQLRSRIPAGASRHFQFGITGTAGSLRMPTPSMGVLAGRTIQLLAHIRASRKALNIHFPSDFCVGR